MPSETLLSEEVLNLETIPENPTDDDEEPDIDPYFGVMPKTPHYTPSQYGGCGGWADEVGYGGCGGSGNRSASCGGSSCGQVYYPRC